MSTTPQSEPKKFSWISEIFRMFRSAWISLLIIAILFLLLTVMDQGGTIFIDLLDHNPFNLLLFLILLQGLCMILSHYPTYIEKWNIFQSLKKDDYRWEMYGNKSLGLGIITYYSEKVEKRKYNFSDRVQSLFRRSLGLFLFAAVIYVSLFYYREYICVDAGMLKGVSSWVLIAATIIPILLIYFLCLRLKQSLGIRLLNLFFILTVLLYAVLLSFCYAYGWSALTFWLWIAGLFFNIFLFSLQRRFRTKLSKKNSLFPLYLQRNHVNYILTMSLTGLLSMTILVWSHIDIFRFNPFVILLAQLIVIYGFLIIPIKHYFYYSYLERNKKAGEVNPFVKTFFIKFTPYLSLLLVAWAIVSGILGNDLHLLNPQAHVQDEVVDYEAYVEAFDEHFKDKEEIYFIASFGGGLKANIWNSFLLNELSDYKGKNILENTAAMSGVSGGSLGQAFFTSLLKNEELYADREAREEKIREMGEKNFVTVDLTYLLGWDLIREFDFFPHKFGPDRAKRAMYQYCVELKDETMSKKSYQNYWGEAFNKKIKNNSFLPALITNSSATFNKRGIACSVDFGNEFSTVFKESVDILNLSDTSSLSYLDAVSCTNRFPIFSPTAKIDGKGHFLDGGYIENSGMLSLKEFYDYLYKHSKVLQDTTRERKVIFLQIANSKFNYLNQMVNADLIEKEIKESAEMNAILKTITSIDFMPNYIVSTSRELPYYAQIHLPYRFDYKDLESLYDAKSIKETDALNTIIANNHQRIKAAIDRKGFTPFDVVQPPLARMVGPQSINYMTAMIKDGFIFQDLDRVLALPLKKTPTVEPSVD